MNKKKTWLDINLFQYQQIQDIFLNETENDDITWMLIQVVYGVNTNEIPISELKSYIDGLSFLNKKMPKMKVKETYNINGTVYELRKELSDFSVAQFIDWQNYIKEGSSIDNAHRLLSVFFIPKGCEYGEGYDVGNVQNDILNNLSIANVNSILAFFLTLQKAYTVRFLLSSQTKMTDGMTRKAKRMAKMEIKKTIKKIALGD